MAPIRSVALELVRSCPLDCLYCYNRWKDPTPGLAAEPEDVERVIDAALASGRFGRADLTGGEPLSRPDFFDLVDRVRGHGARPALVTDGGLIGPVEARALARRDVARVQVPIHSTDPAVHARLKGADSLAGTLRAIGWLHAAGVPVSVDFVCTRLNHDHLDDVLKLCWALKIKDFAFSRLCTTGRALDHREIWPEPESLAACLARLPELGRRHGIDARSNIAVPHCVAPAGRCAMASGAPGFTVDAAGRVRPCSVSDHVLGRLPDDDWAVIEHRYRTELLPALRAATPVECQSCAVLPACGGGCRASAWAATGRADGLDPLARPLTTPRRTPETARERAGGGRRTP